MDNEVPVLNETSDSEDGVSLVDSVSNGLHRSLFTDSEGYFSRCSERLDSDTEGVEEAVEVGDDGEEGEESLEGEFGEGGMQSNVSFREVKMERRRKKIIQEILDTELTYQRHLEDIVTFFETPIRESGLIPAHVIVTIFSNIRQIISVNTELWQHLNMMSTGAAFLKMGPFLKLYSTYANNHERALATLLEWEQKCPEFSQLRRRQEELPELGGLKLNALLITPVQRVPRYKLLLDDLRQNTPSDHADLHALEEATRQISEVASHINDHIKQQDNFMKMLAIQKSLSGPAVPKLLIPGRNFIKEGTLKKVSKSGGRSYERQFFLFSDILMYAKQRLLDSGAHHSYICCCLLPLNHCHASRVFGGHAAAQGTEGALFTVTCKDVSLLLYSEQKTVNSWMTALNTAISAVQESRQTLRKTSSANEPLRRSALVRWTKRQKRNDPLKKATLVKTKVKVGWSDVKVKHTVKYQARKTPEKPNTRSLRRAPVEELDCTPSPHNTRKRHRTDSSMAFFDFGCLTPRTRKRRKTSSGCKSGKENKATDVSSHLSSDSMYLPSNTPREVTTPYTCTDDTDSPVSNTPGDLSTVTWATPYPSPIPEESDTSQKEAEEFQSCSTPAARDTPLNCSTRTPDVGRTQAAFPWQRTHEMNKVYSASPVKPIPTNTSICVLQ